MKTLLIPIIFLIFSGSVFSQNFGIDIASPTQKLDVNGHARIRGDIYCDNNYGEGLVGVYSDVRYQNVWSMGTSWRLPANGTTPGNLYGLAWTHSNIGGQSIGGLSHQLLVMENGSTKVALGSGIWSSYGADLGSNGTYNTFRTWTNLYGYHGLYSGYANGSHFYVNNGSYGAWRIAGNRNGWHGLEFDAEGGNLSLMMSNTAYTWGTQYTGVHNNSYGWLWYFYHQSCYAAGYNYISTRKVKKDILKFNDADYQSALAFVDDLDLNYYRLKDPASGKEMHIGFIAEETPTAVTDGNNEAIDLPQLIFVNTGAIKSLKQRVDNLDGGGSKISDFGVDVVSSGRLIVTFSDEFASQLNGAKPVVTATPSQLGVSMSVSQISQEGFVVEVSPQNQVVTFNWIAMAKTQPGAERGITKVSPQFASFLESAKTEKVGPKKAPELKIVPEGTYPAPKHDPHPVKEAPAPAADKASDK